MLKLNLINFLPKTIILGNVELSNMGRKKEVHFQGFLKCTSKRLKEVPTEIINY
jgi:hypothetical protein